jgi:integrase
MAPAEEIEMASLIVNGRKRIVLNPGPGGKRPTIYLGGIPEQAAREIFGKVEMLIACRRTGVPAPVDVILWLDRSSDEFHAKLAAAGLVDARLQATQEQPWTVGQLLDEYLATSAAKSATRAAYRQGLESLRAFLGADRPVKGITTNDADRWRKHISISSSARKIGGEKPIAPATVAKRVNVARAVFRAAVRWQLVSTSPFDHLKPGSQENRDRAFYVSRAATRAILEACPSVEWRMIVGLCRYAGLRCPSELAALTWADRHIDLGRLIVRSPKTARHAGHEVRTVPICPELRAILEEGFDLADDGAVAMLPRVKSGKVNLRTGLTRIVERAGLSPWPRLFQNLRSSLATDWAQIYPAAEVARWLGHSVMIAARHYVQDRNFDAVVRGPEVSAPVSAQGPENGAQQGPARSRKAPQVTTGNDTIPEGNAVFPEDRAILNGLPVGGTGFEPVTSTV